MIQQNKKGDRPNAEPQDGAFAEYTKEFISKATHPHPCPLPSRERGLKNRSSLDGRGLRGGCLNVSLLMNSLVQHNY